MATKRAVYQIAEYKAVNGASGEFKALVSVFHNVDVQGDRVMKGAFTKSLDRWKQSGDPIPVIWSHQWDNPHAHIGYVTTAVETSEGLQITGKNDIDKPFASQVHDLLTQRRVTGMSFAYDVVDERRAKDGANELTEVGLIEVGPTLKGANPDAQLLQAKSLLEEAAREQEKSDEPDGHKAGRRLSQATRTRLQSMRDELDTLLADDAADDEPKNEPPPAAEDVDANDQEPPAKSDRDDTEKQTDDDREPPAKSPDDELLLIKTRIEKVRAETRRSP